MADAMMWESGTPPACNLARQFFSETTELWKAFSIGGWVTEPGGEIRNTPPPPRVLIQLVSNAVHNGQSEQTAIYYAEQIGSLHAGAGG
jgi:hypothetical protein